MLLRIVAIIFPLFAVVLVGYLYGRTRRPDLTVANQMNLDVFVPALVFGALANRSFHLAEYSALALGGLAIVLIPGLLALPLCRWLGVRLTDASFHAVGLGLAAAATRPLAGMLAAAAATWALPLPPEQESLLVVSGALPPAVLNYVVAERYGQEPEKVASIVLLGNIAPLLFIPIGLALVLER